MKNFLVQGAVAHSIKDMLIKANEGKRSWK